jgi:hypothetical protein
MPTVHLGDFFSLGTLLVALGIYRKINIIVYQHKLMWTDFAKHKGIDAKANGASA